MRSNTGTPLRVPLSLDRFGDPGEGIALRLARKAPTHRRPLRGRASPWLACAASRCAFDINQTTAGRHIGRLAPPIKRAKASARASRGQAIDPNTQRTDMNDIAKTPGAAAAQPQAQSCPLDSNRAGRQARQWNDTPDAMCHCAA